MRRWFLPMLVLAFLALIISACASSPAPEPPTPQPAGPVFGWEKRADVVVVRLDRLIGGEPDYERLNRLPACTVYGDGHVVWVNPIPPNGEEVLEAYIDDVKMREFLEYIIRDQKFYGVPDFAAQELPPTEDSPIESITVSLNQEVRTIRSYRSWPNDTYLAILERCRSLSETRALLVPAGAWITVFPDQFNTNIAQIAWSPAAPVRLADASASGKATWVSGVALRQLWRYQRETLGQIQWIERGKAYRVAIQVPGVSRDAPPPPPGSETPTPLPSETPEGASE